MAAAIWVSRTQSKAQQKAAQQEADRQGKLKSAAWEIELEAAAQVIEKLGGVIENRLYCVVFTQRRNTLADPYEQRPARLAQNASGVVMRAG